MFANIQEILQPADGPAFGDGTVSGYAPEGATGLVGDTTALVGDGALHGYESPTLSAGRHSVSLVAQDVARSWDSFVSPPAAKTAPKAPASGGSAGPQSLGYGTPNGGVSLLRQTTAKVEGFLPSWLPLPAAVIAAVVLVSGVVYFFIRGSKKAHKIF